MKTAITLALSLTTIVMSVLVPTSSAVAAPAIHHGSVCHNYNKGEANNFDFFWDGATASPNAGTVICPLVTTQTAGQTTGYVYVDTNLPANTSAYCTLVSYNYNDTYLGSQGLSIAAGSTSGYHTSYIGTVPNQYYASHAVICSLPAYGKVVEIESNF